MEFGDFIKSGIGAVIGFSLAQLVSAAKLFWDWWNQPKFEIKSRSAIWLLLSHTTETQGYECYDEDIYGFQLRNTGRGIATGVRIQLIKIEYYDEQRSKYIEVSEHAHDLSLYTSAGRQPDNTEIVLVPGANVDVQLASWREDYDVIFPSVSALPDYYEEICYSAPDYRFTVVAFDDKGHFVQEVLTLVYSKRRGASVISE